MNCREISQKTIAAKTVVEEILQMNPAGLKDQLDRYLDLKKQFKEIMSSVEHAEPNQYRIRERIAKKFDFSFVGQLSGEVFCGEKKIGDRSEYYLVNTTGDKVVAGPFLHFYDGGMGNYLVYKRGLKDGKEVVEYKLIDKNGALIRNLGVEGEVHLPVGRFYDSQPLLVHYYGPDGNVSRREYLRPDGEIILKRSGAGPQTQTFSEGLIWEVEEVSDIFYTLYNDKGEIVAICEDESITGIREIKDGIAIGFKKTPAPISDKVVTVDLQGQVKDTKQLLQSTMVNRYGDIIVGKNSFGKTYYFTTDGKVLDVPAAEFSGYVNSKEKVIKVETDAKYKFVNYENIPISDLTFEIAREFSEGVVAVKVLDDGWHYMDKDGNFNDLGAYNFTGLNSFKNGRAVVSDTDGIFIIDRAGKDLFSGGRLSFDKWVSPQDRMGVYKITEKGSGREYYIKPNGERVF